MKTTTAMLVGVFLTTMLYWFDVCCCLAKEIEATHEWTLIGENDTLPAGLHIRIDMTTGEKWAKLMDTESATQPTTVAAVESSSTETTSRPLAQQSSSSSKELQVTERGIVTELPASASLETTAASHLQEDHDSIHYDFDMMYRTLSKLPEDEVDKMQLPSPPPSQSNGDTAAAQRRDFEQRLLAIWERRQEQLRNLDLADLPQLLKDRIQAIRDYLQGDPATATTSVHNMVDVLKDLEYQLQDIDMTRDFHTLGGWSLLAILLDDAVHHHRLRLNQTIDETNQVQLHAAWAMGTAVKNTAEFAPYVLEPIRNPFQTNIATTTTSALNLVVSQLKLSLHQHEQSPLSRVLDLKIRRLVYCLGSFLRGNRAAQVQFGPDGPDILATTLQRLVQSLDSDTKTAVEKDAHGTNAFARKLAERLLNLATDMVLDVTLHISSGDGSQTDDSSTDLSIVSSWTSPEWCRGLLALARYHPVMLLYDSAVPVALPAMAPYCQPSWPPEEISALLETMALPLNPDKDQSPEMRALAELQTKIVSILQEMIA
jgi:nucleotide exchange factor SIL1